MYDSLKKEYKNFHLYIFAFDDHCFEILSNLKLENSTIISLKEFEDSELLKVKPTRTVAEYCWTCTPSVVLYCLKKYGLSGCTYLDADIYFYNNPQKLIDEVNACSVLITEHRYTKKYDQSRYAGIYNVQFVGFKNDEYGLEALHWWRERCLEWCYNRIEDGKLGDQKYLDDWLTRFKGVAVLKNLGGGVAPWNVTQYDPFLENNKVKAKKIDDGFIFDLIFYHFHGLKFYNETSVDLGHYTISENTLNLIYRPYLKHLKANYHLLYLINSKLDTRCMQTEKFNWWNPKHYFKYLKRKINNCDNRFELTELI